MALLHSIEVLVLTFNEEANIARTLDALAAFARVVILDSGSSDQTLRIASRYANVRVASRPFDTHAQQWNHGLTMCGITADWVLALDADYVLTPDVVEELRTTEPPPQTHGYWASFRYCVEGRPLSASLYPPVMVLFRRESAHYVQDGHTQRVVVRGAVQALRHPILHDDRKGLAAWLVAQDKYARLECDLLLRTPWRALGWRDRLRQMMFITPWLVPVYCLTVGRGLLDGRRGLFYALQRGVAESILSLRLLQARIHRQTSP